MAFEFHQSAFVASERSLNSSPRLATFAWMCARFDEVAASGATRGMLQYNVFYEPERVALFIFRSTVYISSLAYLVGDVRLRGCFRWRNDFWLVSLVRERDLCDECARVSMEQLEQRRFVSIYGSTNWLDSENVLSTVCIPGSLVNYNCIFCY